MRHLATSSNALVTSSFLLLVAMPGATSSFLLLLFEYTFHSFICPFVSTKDGLQPTTDDLQSKRSDGPPKTESLIPLVLVGCPRFFRLESDVDVDNPVG